MMDAVTLLTWAQVVLELGTVGKDLLDLGRRIDAGETVTAAELDAAKQATKDAVARWDAAAGADRKD